MSDGKVRIVSVKGGEPFFVWKIDAKECVASGNFIYAGEEVVSVAVQKEIKSVETMTTASLNKVVETEGLVIEGFESMNLKEKREAVAKALAAPKIETSVEVTVEETSVETEVDDI